MTPLAAAQSIGVFAWLDSTAYARPIMVGIADRRSAPADAVLEALFLDGVLGAERCVPWLRTGASETGAICAYTAILGGRGAQQQCRPELGRIQSGFVLNPAADDKLRLAREFRDVLGSAVGRSANSVFDLVRAPAPAEDALQVDVLAGAVRRGGCTIALSEGEFGIVGALALSARSQPLCEVLWPEREPDCASKLLRVYVHRIRAKAGTKALFEAFAHEYRLGRDVRVDVDEAEAALRRARAGARLDPDAARVLQRAFADFCGGGYRRLAHLDQYAALERRIVRLGGEIAQALVDDAWSRDERPRALQIAEELLDADPCGELGIELTVRAQLALGNHDAAVRRYRDYCRALRDELDCAPPQHLTALLSARGYDRAG
jgi:DNA-binding SARP family transcriptional activator